MANLLPFFNKTKRHKKEGFETLTSKLSWSCNPSGILQAPHQSAYPSPNSNTQRRSYTNFPPAPHHPHTPLACIMLNVHVESIRHWTRSRARMRRAVATPSEQTHLRRPGTYTLVSKDGIEEILGIHPRHHRTENWYEELEGPQLATERRGGSFGESRHRCQSKEK